MIDAVAKVAGPSFTKAELLAELKYIRALPKCMRSPEWKFYKLFLSKMLDAVKKAKRESGGRNNHLIVARTGMQR
jgi:hypothetical protein